MVAKGRSEDLQAQLAQLQLDTMKTQVAHLEKMRELELEKARVELETAKLVNAAVRRVEKASELPPIKVS